MFGEVADEMLLTSQRVVPARLQATGFDFQYPNVEEALRALIRESASRRLAEAGGTMPEHRSPPRRRPA
jgi:Arc/MetJ family transcription regulator